MQSFIAAVCAMLSLSLGGQGLTAGAVTYDPAIPTLKAVTGHDPGDAITTPEEIGRYLDALAKAAPDRARLVPYATSWEGRPLQYLVIGSPVWTRSAAACRRSPPALPAPSA